MRSALFAALVCGLAVQALAQRLTTQIAYGGFEEIVVQGTLSSAGNSLADAVSGVHGGWTFHSNNGRIIATEGTAYSGKEAVEGVNYVCLENSASMSVAGVVCDPDVRYGVTFKVIKSTNDQGLIITVDSAQVYAIPSVTVSEWTSITSQAFNCPESGFVSISVAGTSSGDKTACVDDFGLTVIPQIPSGGFEGYTPTTTVSSTSKVDRLTGTVAGWVLEGNTAWTSGNYLSGAVASEGLNYMCLTNSAQITTANKVNCDPGNRYAITFKYGHKASEDVWQSIEVFVDDERTLYAPVMDRTPWGLMRAQSFTCPREGNFTLSLKTSTTGGRILCIDDVVLAKSVQVPFGGFESYTPSGNLPEDTTATSKTDSVSGTVAGWNISPRRGSNGVVWTYGEVWAGIAAPEGAHYICLENTASVATSRAVPCEANSRYSVAYRLTRQNSGDMQEMSVYVDDTRMHFVKEISITSWANVKSEPWICPSRGFVVVSFNTTTEGGRVACIDDVTMPRSAQIPNGGFEGYNPSGKIEYAANPTAKSDFVTGTHNGWVLEATRPSYVEEGSDFGVVWAYGSYWAGKWAPEGNKFVCLQATASIRTVEPVACLAGSLYTISFRAAKRNNFNQNNDLTLTVNSERVLSISAVAQPEWTLLTSQVFMCPDNGELTVKFSSTGTTERTVCMDDVSLNFVNHPMPPPPPPMPSPAEETTPVPSPEASPVPSPEPSPEASPVPSPEPSPEASPVPSPVPSPQESHNEPAPSNTGLPSAADLHFSCSEAGTFSEERMVDIFIGLPYDQMGINKYKCLKEECGMEAISGRYHVKAYIMDHLEQCRHCVYNFFDTCRCPRTCAEEFCSYKSDLVSFKCEAKPSR